MNSSFHAKSFGVFKPVGHVVVSFARPEQVDEAMEHLAQQGVPGEDISRYDDRQMIEQIDADLADAGLLASLGQELNLIKAHRALAERGYHWLVIRAENREAALQVAQCVAACGAERAQYYGHLVIEELVEHGDEQHQVAESPDRQLDAQTLSGTEAERAALRGAVRH